MRNGDRPHFSHLEPAAVPPGATAQTFLAACHGALYTSTVHFRTTMAKVNITELRQNLPAYVARVREGETLEVTVRGRVIARIVPEQDRAAAARERLKALRGKARI